MDYLIKLAENNVFSGILFGSFVASVLFTLKGIPVLLWEGFKWRVSTKLIIYNEDPSFDRTLEWLSSLDYVKRARVLRLKISEISGGEASFYAPGLGTHLIWYQNRPLLIKLVLDKDSGTSWQRRETLILQLIGWSPSAMHALIDEIVSAQSLSQLKMTDVYLYSEHRWSLACRKPKRLISTVILPVAQQQRILDDIDVFLKRRQWYANRGLPYRRGFLFEGPPGCGKTSLVMALAAQYSKPIYALNLGSLKSDNDLIQAITTVPENAILLMEDVDAAQSKRSLSTDKVTAPQQLSLSGLLNAIDGTFSKDGRILIMTTNHMDTIDPAILRCGRVDHREHIGLLGLQEATQMCRQFLGDDSTRADTLDLPITPALLQEILLNESP